MTKAGDAEETHIMRLYSLRAVDEASTPQVCRDVPLARHHRDARNVASHLMFWFKSSDATARIIK